jgi:hypothetical protein
LLLHFEAGSDNIFLRHNATKGQAMKLVKGGHKGIKSIILLGVNPTNPYGKVQIGHIKGKGFKVRDLARIKRNGGEFSWETEYFSTLKQALNRAKAIL